MSARKFELHSRTKTRFGNVTISRGAESTAVILHGTAVVTWDRPTMTVMLDSGGWRTVTTKAAINNALRQIFPAWTPVVFQQNHAWLVALPDGRTIEFRDGMTLRRKTAAGR